MNCCHGGGVRTLCVPALAGAFGRHPLSGDARAVRHSVERGEVLQTVSDKAELPI